MKNAHHPNPVIGIASRNAAVIINILIVNEMFDLLTQLEKSRILVLRQAAKVGFS